MPELLEALGECLGDLVTESSEDAEITEEAVECSSKFKRLWKQVRSSKLERFAKTKKVLKRLNALKIHKEQVSANNLIQKSLKNNGVSRFMRKKVSNVKINTRTPNKYQWHYLVDEKHSDRAIYRARIRSYYESKSKKDIYIALDIQFSSSGIIYTYFKVPLSIALVMFYIDLTYLTKNNFWAGAWNWFWYSWWYKQADNNLMRGVNREEYAKKFRFSPKWKEIKNGR